jgi:pyruvate carboxylase
LPRLRSTPPTTRNRSTSARPIQPTRSRGGARAYLDIEAVIAAAKATGCDALHPGYGFLSENAALARRCAEESITFIGPSPAALDLFGDKARAKALAKDCGVPIIEGTSGPTSLEQAKDFFASLGAGVAVMIKAIAGGGGRGMRIVDDAEKLEEAYARCQSEAKAAFGSDGVYVERLIRNARHIEVQIVGDHHGAISHLWERECTIQRRNQKLIEVAPSPSLSEALRSRIISAERSSPPPRTTTISARLSSWSMAMPEVTPRPSPSSRPIRGCRSSTP